MKIIISTGTHRYIPVKSACTTIHQDQPIGNKFANGPMDRREMAFYLRVAGSRANIFVTSLAGC